jgi:type IV fimbrial biogenesis protein FimT
MHRFAVSSRVVVPVLRSRQRGLSLHELLTSVSISGALATVAVGGIQPLLERQRLTADVNQLVSQLNLTRSDAVRRATPVTLCKSADGASCTPSSRWEQGWIVFVDKDEDLQVSGDEPVIRVQQSLSTGHTLELRAALGRNDSVTYHPNGQSEKNGTFTLCGRHGAAKTVILNRIGRARVSERTGSGDRPTCPNGGTA